MNEHFIHSLERELSQNEVWLPPVVRPDGKVENIIQGSIVYSGAGKGETNYKTRKRPRKYGKFETEQGTFVANNHYRKEIVGTVAISKSGKKFIKPTADGLVADGDGSIRILKLGRLVKLHKSPGWDKQFADAGNRALDKIKSGSCKFQAGDSRTRADMVKGPAIQANVFADGGSART